MFPNLPPSSPPALGASDASPREGEGEAIPSCDLAAGDRLFPEPAEAALCPQRRTVSHAQPGPARTGARRTGPDEQGRHLGGGAGPASRTGTLPEKGGETWAPGDEPTERAAPDSGSRGPPLANLRFPRSVPPSCEVTHASAVSQGAAPSRTSAHAVRTSRLGPCHAEQRRSPRVASGLPATPCLVAEPWSARVRGVRLSPRPRLSVRCHPRHPWRRTLHPSPRALARTAAICAHVPTRSPCRAPPEPEAASHSPGDS